MDLTRCQKNNVICRVFCNEEMDCQAAGESIYESKTLFMAVSRRLVGMGSLLILVHDLFWADGVILAGCRNEGAWRSEFFTSGQIQYH
jgi:hypothetical protein